MGPEEILLEEGQIVDNIYFIMEGELEIYQNL
jgi:CRP-like cAMP-binding protein